MANLEIVHVNTKPEAEALRDAGFEPVECSFGHLGSVVGKLTMDHHGELSHLTGVAVRAYAEHFGARRDDPRFVVTGCADADMCFAIAALAGLLPHPSLAEKFADAPETLRISATRDISALAALVNRMDVAPIGVRLEESEDGCLLLLWEQLSSASQDATAVFGGVDRWRSLLRSRQHKALLEAAKAEEAARVQVAREAIWERISDKVVFVESEAWGFDVWYAELAPCIVSYTRRGGVTIGCVNKQTAESLFGPGGLKNVFATLTPEGWGGREAIGGSPRGLELTRAEALAAAIAVASKIAVS